MKTKIKNTIRQWAPEVINIIPDYDFIDGPLADYEILHRLAEVCVQKNTSFLDKDLSDVQAIIKAVNLLYLGGSQYTCNIIENEFLTIFSLEESPGSLKKHLDIFPIELRKAYLKTILEN